jgi:uncharacterized protein (TIGR02145 family)
MTKTIILFWGFAFLYLINQAQTVTDIDGNVYNTVTIGTQTWMQENLKVTHYRNGDLIPNDTSSTQWSNLTTGAYCNDYNDSSYVSIYGRLYNWYTVNDSRNCCPIGWHVPTYSEWTVLTNYLGGDSIAGGKLKEIGYTHWQSPNTGADNSSNFTALAGGFRAVYGSYNYIGTEEGSWWSTTDYNGVSAWCCFAYYNNTKTIRFYNPEACGFSVRCLSDSAVNQINENSINKNILIYPNPATNRVFITITDRLYLKMQIYNAVGECVLQRELSGGTNDIDISSLSKGNYVIKLTSTDWTVQRKLTKE